ncbi:MAG TPA: methyltransferase domain-containing protein [Solirubrobacter sp.]|nr:methyltransferase domain-containing protein [Solirubrobacter sp.]
MSLYERTAGAYGRRRAEDPRIAAVIHAALGDARTVVNVGAGKGAYEPRDRDVTPVEPEPAMSGSRPAVQAYAEDLPFADDAFDAAMAVLTIHHWTDWRKGAAELRRVARDRVVVFTFEPSWSRALWLVDEYLPELADIEAHFPTPAQVLEALGGGEIQTVPISHDCRDGFFGAYWRRPHAYLDPDVQQSISSLALLDPAVRERGLGALDRDLGSGAWEQRHADLIDRPELDLGYRLVIARHN